MFSEIFFFWQCQDFESVFSRNLSLTLLIILRSSIHLTFSSKLARALEKPCIILERTLTELLVVDTYATYYPTLPGTLICSHYPT